MYPTKEEIIKEINDKNPGEIFIKTIKKWKKQNYTKWKEKEKAVKKIALEDLAKMLYKYIKKKEKTRKKIKIIWGKEWSYEKEREIITGEENRQSIISMLHEIGHYIYGESELKACAFSINMFQRCFKKDYEKLKWEGHMLVKK